MDDTPYRDKARIANLRTAASALRAAPNAKKGNEAYESALYRVEKLTCEFNSTRYVLETIDAQLDFPLFTTPKSPI